MDKYFLNAVDWSVDAQAYLAVYSNGLKKTMKKYDIDSQIPTIIIVEDEAKGS